MAKLLKSLFFLLSAFTLVSCTSSKDLHYFQDINKGHRDLKIDATYEQQFIPGDKLQIVVSGPDKEVVTPYNFTLINSTDRAVGSTAVFPYLVDNEGNINVSGLGRIHAAGMTRAQLESTIEKILIDGGLVKNPIVSVQRLNFNVTVMGDVKSPGTYTMNGERATLLQALSMAGDLTNSAERTAIVLIRDIDGVQTHTNIDLTSADVLNSPYFYLKQNDIIYVPQNAKRVSIGTSSLSIWGVILSTLSTTASMVALILNMLKLK